MGLTWIIANISGYVEGFKDAPRWRETIFFITDTINAMQGIFVFIFLIFERNVYMALVNRFNAIFFRTIN